jgi:GTPase SAR1 family protein
MDDFISNSEIKNSSTSVLRVTLLGAPNTGKSTFASSVVTRNIVKGGSTTSLPYRRTTKNITRFVPVNVKDSPMLHGIHLEDTVGTVKITKDLLLSDGDALSNSFRTYIIFFDLSNIETLKIAEELIVFLREPERRRKKSRDFYYRPMFLIGTKRDIAPREILVQYESRFSKLAVAQRVHILVGSVIFNSFTNLYKPYRRDDEYETKRREFCDLLYIVQGEDKTLQMNSTETLSCLKAICDQTREQDPRLDGSERNPEEEPFLPGGESKRQSKKNWFTDCWERCCGRRRNPS